MHLRGARRRVPILPSYARRTGAILALTVAVTALFVVPAAAGASPASHRADSRKALVAAQLQIDKHTKAVNDTGDMLHDLADDEQRDSPPEDAHDENHYEGAGRSPRPARLRLHDAVPRRLRRHPGG